MERLFGEGRQGFGMSGASFKGNLEVLNLSDIFQSLAMNRHSGTLIISDGKREKKIFFAEGEIQLLSSSRRMKLGELLIATGKIGEEDLDLALKLQKQNRKKLGEILVEEGFCEEEDVARIVKFQIEEEIYDLFLWRKAEFEFIADHLPEDMKRDSSNLMRLSLNTNLLIMEALRRLDEWELVKQAVPSTKEIFTILDERKLAEIDLPDRLKTEIHLIDGKTNVEGLAEKTMISEFELCKLLAELVHQGAIASLPMEKLVQKAEESYAVNDFTAAANLYGRLAELAPGEPKVLIPLAESLRRSGDDRQALLIFQEIANKLDPVRDVERLRRCWETIVALDPERSDIVRKIEQLNARTKKRRRTGLGVPVVVVLVAGLAAGGGVFHDKLEKLWKQLSADPHKGEKAENERLAEELLQQQSNAENGEHDYRKSFEIGVRIWREYPNTAARNRVQLPLLVRTEPTGFAVFVNDLLKGETSVASPVLRTAYTTQFDKVRIDIRRIPPKGMVPDIKVDPLARRQLDNPMAWPGEVVFSIDDEPEKRPVLDTPVETELAYHKASKSWVVVTREGKVRLLDETLAARDGWPDLFAGPYGDTFTAVTVSGDNAYVGLASGGVALVDLAKKTLTPSAFPADTGAVTGRPYVTASGRVAFGTTAGTIHGFGGPRPWRFETDGAVAFPGVAGDDSGETVVFASDDERLRALDTATGKPVWTTVTGAPAAPLVRAKEWILLANTAGELLAVSGRTGKIRERTKDFQGRPFRFCVDDNGDRIFVATEDGRVRALDAADFKKKLWPEDFVRPTKVAPWLAYLPAVGAIPDRLVVSFDDPVLLGIDTRTGILSWRGNMGSGLVAGPITVEGSVFLVPSTTLTINLFRRQ